MSTNCPVCASVIDENASACPYCGFKLLGTTQQFKPLVLDEEIAREQKEADRASSLRVIRGPQTGVVIRLGDCVLSVGRSPKCDIFLNDMTVSRKHAEIVPQNGSYRIVDKKSFNGVWVNNVNVDEKILAPGDVIQIGTFLLLYEVE